MTQDNINTILMEAKEAGVEVSFYEWTQSKQYRRGVHTDSIEYVCGTLTGMEDLSDYEIDRYSIYDAEELNRTIYANTGEYAEEDEMIVMIEKTK